MNRRFERDTALICAAAFLRSLTVGVVGVVLAIYLARARFTALTIGLVIGSGLTGSALATLLVARYGDTFGRRRSLAALTALTAVGYAGLLETGSLAALVAIAFLGMLNGMGRDRGAATALDQAVLPDTTGFERRTWVLAWYNVVLDCGHALGALAAATPTLLVRSGAFSTTGAHRVIFLACAGVMLASLGIYASLSDRVEVHKQRGSDCVPRPLDAQSHRRVTRLALLFGLDSLGGGFLNSALIAYWFFSRYGMSEAELAVLFFVARLLNTGSHVAAAWVAHRVGLVNTMVLTHLPSSLFLMAAPAAPSATLAAALFLAREALVEMDVPTRQSYVVGIVHPEERTFASAMTNVVRSAGWAAGPSVAGVIMQHLALSGPLIIGGTLKIAYDIILYFSFRHVHPPEEITQVPGTRI